MTDTGFEVRVSRTSAHVWLLHHSIKKRLVLETLHLVSSGNCEPGHVSTVVGEPASTALTYRVAGSAHCGGDN